MGQERISSYTKSPAGYGHWLVKHVSPVTGRMRSGYTSDAQLIDKTFGEEYPTQRALKALKRITK